MADKNHEAATLDVDSARACDTVIERYRYILERISRDDNVANGNGDPMTAAALLVQASLQF